MENEQIKHLVKKFDNLFHLSMKKFASRMEENVSPLTKPQFFLLKLLNKKEKCTVSELADMFEVKPSSITNMIDRLEKMDYVVRIRDAEDRRVVYMKLSEEGKKILKETGKKREEMMEKYLKHMEVQEIETLISIYEKMLSIDFDKE